MAETLRDLGVVVDHPAAEHLRGRLGRRRLAVRAARGGRQDARQLHPARAAPGPLRAGHHQQPRRRPDRPAARSTSTSTRCAPSAPRSSTATATTSPRRPAGCAAATVTFPHGDRHGHGERDAGGDPRRRPHDHPAGGPGAGGRRPDRASCSKMGAEVERTAPDTIEVEGRRRLRGADHRVVPDRIEAGTFVVAAAVTGGQLTLEEAPCASTWARSSTSSATWACPSPAAGRPHRGATASTGARAATAPRDIETAPYPGLATDLQPPTCVLLTQAQRHQPRPRDDLRGPPRVARRAAPHGRRRDPIGRPARAGSAGPLEPPRCGAGDRRPAGRRLADPGRPRGRGRRR